MRKLTVFVLAAGIIVTAAAFTLTSDKDIKPNVLVPDIGAGQSTQKILVPDIGLGNKIGTIVLVPDIG